MKRSLLLVLGLGGALIAVWIVLAEPPSSRDLGYDSGSGITASPSPPAAVEDGVPTVSSQVERAEPAAGSGLEFWQKRYAERLAAGTVTIRADDDWWYADEEVMALFRARLQQEMSDLEAKLAAWDERPRPWIRLEDFSGVEQPLGAVLSDSTLDSPYLRYYESTLLAGDLARMAENRKRAGLTPFGHDRPLLSIAEMSADPFSFPPEYFLQAFSNRVADAEWMALKTAETRRIWEAYSLERASLRGEYYTRVSAIQSTARALRLLWPHVSHYDDFLPGTSALAGQIRSNETEYIRELRDLALADGPPR